MSIVETPWADLLEDFVSAAETNLMIATPFFSSDVLRKVFRKCRRNIKIRLLLGNITAQTVAEGTTDSSAIEEILRRKSHVECKCIKELHAKVLVADSLGESPRAIVTSSNLTKEGLLNNIEFGIMVEGSLAKEIARRLTSYWNDPNAESLSQKKFTSLLSESRKIKKTVFPRAALFSIGGHVHPKGMGRIKIVIDKRIVHKVIERLRRSRGYGYPNKKREIHVAQNLLLKVRRRDLNKRDFERILNTIDKWTGAIRIGNMDRILANNIGKVNKSLRILLDEGKPLSTRIDSLLYEDHKLTGGALGFISAMLFVNDSERYNLYNERVFRGLLRVLGPSIKRAYDGVTYESFNLAVMRFKKRFDLQDMETDYVLFELG